MTPYAILTAEGSGITKIGIGSNEVHAADAHWRQGAGGTPTAGSHAAAGRPVLGAEEMNIPAFSLSNVKRALAMPDAGVRRRMFWGGLSSMALCLALLLIRHFIWFDPCVGLNCLLLVSICGMASSCLIHLGASCPHKRAFAAARLGEW